MSSTQLVKLVNLFHEYELAKPHADIEDFCRHHLKQSSKSVALLPPEEESRTELYPYLASLVGRLGRFASMYAKKALTGSSLGNIDDFVYLMVLKRMGSPRKGELALENLSEFSTSVEVMRRLIKSGLIEEFPDAVDKRSKRIRITQKGEQELSSVMPEMNKAATIAFGTLSMDEIKSLVTVLGRLDQLHAVNYPEMRNKSWQEIQKEEQWTPVF